jgi:TetR/AcrR family transcriptional regulator, lmrAB and yxaGH operons repressor
VSGATKGSTKQRMLVSAAEVLRERGAAGVTIDEVLARSGAPRGSVYHHFPDGRNQILAEALQFAGESIADTIGKLADSGDAVVLIRRFAQYWESVLTNSNFTAGCPVVAAAIGSADDEPQLTAVAGAIFGRWRESLAQSFIDDGFAEADAGSLAVTCIAALEGAVVLSRSTRSTEPLEEVVSQVQFLVKAKEFVQRFGMPNR